MARSMYVNVVNEEESRIAIVDDGLLEELSIETSFDELIEGNIYKAKVEKVLPGLDAVFVDYGREKNGFIALSEVRGEYFTNGDRKPENLKRGREMMVQVKKGEIGNKGAALTTYISIPGRYLVLMPHVDKRGVSRQIENEQTRKMLHDAITETSIPEGIGYIVRTAAEDQKKQDIQRDVMYLLRMWKRVQTLYDKATGPGLIYREGDLVIRTIRDYFAPEMKELLVDDQKVYERVAAFFRAVMPWHAKKVTLYDGRAPLFTKHNLEAQIASIHEEKVKLPSGGSIVIQQTEALVSVDVNSGAGTKNKDIEQTAFATNMEAASEVARQLRLRDLGGLIVVDFIDMRSSANQASVKKEIQKALKNDKAQTDVGSISKFGLLELSRQRLRRAAAPKISMPCTLCGGAGKLRSTESFALLVLRIVHSALAKQKYSRVSVGVSPDTAAFLFNRKRRQLNEFEELFGAKVEVYGESILLPNQYHIDFLGEKNRVETNLPQSFAADNLLCRVERKRVEAGTPYGGASYESLSEDGEPEEEVEVPDEPKDPVQQEAGTQAVEGEKPQSAGKKRRRRRRRRKSGQNNGGADAQGAPQATEEPIKEEAVSATVEEKPAAEPSSAPVSAEVETPPPAESAEPEGAAGGESVPAKKPGRRRSRGRKSKKPAAEGANSAQTPEAAPAEPAEPAPPGEPKPDTKEVKAEGDGTTGEEKPAKKRAPRRRRRRKPAKEAGGAPPAGEEG